MCYRVLNKKYDIHYTKAYFILHGQLMARHIVAVLLGNQQFSNMIFQIRSNTTLDTRNLKTVNPNAATFSVIKHEYGTYAPTKYCDNRMDLSYSHFVRKKTAITFDNEFRYNVHMYSFRKYNVLNKKPKA